MINVVMAATLMMAQYGYSSPPPSKYEDSSSAEVDTAPFVQHEKKCFDQAEKEASGAAQDVKQQRFDKCVALHAELVTYGTAKLSGQEATSAKKAIDKALHGVEKSYAKKMGVTMPEAGK